MTEPWLEITAGARKERVSLAPGRTRLGGKGCDVRLAGSQGDELHVWSRPAKVLFVGERTTPLLNGRAFEEAPLTNGDSIQWCEAVLVFGGAGAGVLEELSPVPASRKGSARKSSAATDTARTDDAAPLDASRCAQRVHAGLLAELGLSDRKEVKRWQAAVLRGEFNADACARDLLRGSNVEADDPRLLERAGRLERDLLMSAFQRGARGAARKARGAARSGIAMILSQTIAILVYSLILVVIFALLRAQQDLSVDGWLDRILGIFD